MGLTPHPLLEPKVLEKSRAILRFTLRACVAYEKIKTYLCVYIYIKYSYPYIISIYLYVIPIYIYVYIGIGIGVYIYIYIYIYICQKVKFLVLWSL